MFVRARISWNVLDEDVKDRNGTSYLVINAKSLYSRSQLVSLPLPVLVVLTKFPEHWERNSPIVLACCSSDLKGAKPDAVKLLLILFPTTVTATCANRLSCIKISQYGFKDQSGSS